MMQVSLYPVFAASVFEGAENERAAAVVLHMVSQVLPGDVGCAALVWALDRKPRAVVLVVLQRSQGQRYHVHCIADSMSDKNTHTQCTVGLQINGCMGKNVLESLESSKNTCGIKNEGGKIVQRKKKKENN